MHYMRLRRTGTTNLLPRDPERCNLWRGDQVGYSGAHWRIRKAKGAATDHDCAHCDATAVHWAYDHTDPDQRTNDTGLTYSLDPSHYLPLCASCHVAFDDNNPRRFKKANVNKTSA